MKKRNKKYNPNKPAINPVRNVVTCFSAFRNQECLRKFKCVQLVTLGNGLGVAA